MVAIKINGSESPILGEGGAKMTDILELVKSYIDPDHMITNIFLNGQELNENDWHATASQLGTSTIEIETGTPQNYVVERFSHAASIIDACTKDFATAKVAFKSGQTMEGNRSLRIAVDTLRTFFEWYGTLLELISQEEKDRLNINSYVVEISETCKKICQHQLYQSWWALAQSIENDLEPRLANLRDFYNGATSIN